MKWIWELKQWPNFEYNTQAINSIERQFLLNIGSYRICYSNLDKKNQHQFLIEILTTEGLKSSKIEGEILRRESLQSSIQGHFGLKITNKHKNSQKEKGIARALCDVYQTFNQPLTHETLWNWHQMIFNEWSTLSRVGAYRNHPEDMQIISRHLEGKIIYQAPTSKNVFKEMERFIHWYNTKGINQSHSILVKASLVHLYFECIHPFEDGNGRIGRLLIEKTLSQELGLPVLICVSKQIESGKKEYYSQLSKCNQTLNVQSWIEFFSNIILKAQEESMALLNFIILKSKTLERLKGQINQRQEKVLLKIFAQGPKGFLGGLSAENYISITKASRATATRDLADLVEKEVLIKTGELRYTRYWLK